MLLFNADTRTSVPVAPGKNYLLRENQHIDKTILAHGEWEGKLKAALVSSVDPNRNFLDIGANLGDWSLWASKLLNPGCYVYAFEPQRHIFCQFCANLFLNDVQNVVPFHCALGSKSEDGAKTIVRNMIPNNDGGNVCTASTEGIQPHDVLFRTLDSFNITNVGFIKIDVEGHEEKVLREAESLLRRDRPVIAFECWSRPSYAEKKASLFSFLQSLDYEIVYMPHESTDTWQAEDWLAIPK